MDRQKPRWMMLATRAMLKRCFSGDGIEQERSGSGVGHFEAVKTNDGGGWCGWSPALTRWFLPAAQDICQLMLPAVAGSI